MTIEELVKRTIKETVEEIVTDQYYPIVDEVKHRAQSANDQDRKVIVAASVRDHFVAALNGVQQEQEVRESPIRPIKTDHNVRQWNFNIGLIVAFVSAILATLLFLFVMPIPVGWPWNSFLIGVAVGCLVYLIASWIQAKRRKEQVT